MSLSSTIRKLLGWSQSKATWAAQAEAEADNALKDVTDAAAGSLEANKNLIQTHQELRKSVHAFEPFVQLERLMKEEYRRKGVRFR